MKFYRWLVAADEIMSVRRNVFVFEQRLGKGMVADTWDHECEHILVRSCCQEPIGCGRLSPRGHVGKIAVAIGHRGAGIGSQILDTLTQKARSQTFRNVTLNAEVTLVDFYLQRQFMVDGPVYMKRGIPHQRLVKYLR